MEAKKAEIEQVRLDYVRRDYSKEKAMGGSETTDCVYIIKIDSKVVYVGQTSDYDDRTRTHGRQLFKLMRARHPNAEILMQRVWTGDLVGGCGAPLDVVEAWLMEKCDTLKRGSDPEGVGENEFRYNINRAPCTVNGMRTSPEYMERIMKAVQAATCDRPSTEPCPGDDPKWWDGSALGVDTHAGASD